MQEKERKPVIEIKNLRKSFGTTDVLKDVSINLYEGENLVVMGKSGTGKSVLIKCIVRLLQPDAGSINVLGREVNKLDRQQLGEMRKQVGFLFQSGALYDSMSVKQNLEFTLKGIIKGITDKEVDEKIKEVLENVGLANAIDKMPSELSGGMRKRIGLARTIIVNPSIILYDEPTTGLDPATSDEISMLINLVKEKYKTSSIIITHDIECVKLTADRIIMLKEGLVYTEGKLDHFTNTTDPILKSFFK